nr:hypothetical protein [Bidens alba var. radiata]
MALPLAIQNYDSGRLFEIDNQLFLIDLEIQGLESALKTTQFYLEKTTQLLLDYGGLSFNPVQEKIEKDRKKIQQLEEELSGFRKEQRKLQQEQRELIVRITCQENRRL